jgi:hypothetical protein
MHNLSREPFGSCVQRNHWVLDGVFNIAPSDQRKMITSACRLPGLSDW